MVQDLRILFYMCKTSRPTSKYFDGVKIIYTFHFSDNKAYLLPCSKTKNV